MELSGEGKLLCFFVIVLSLASLVFFLQDRFSSASEQELKQAKIDCPTIAHYINLNTTLSPSDLRGATAECKQLTMQRSIFKN